MAPLHCRICVIMRVVTTIPPQAILAYCFQVIAVGVVFMAWNIDKSRTWMKLAAAVCESSIEVVFSGCTGKHCSGEYVTACRLKFVMGLLDFIALGVLFALFFGVFWMQDKQSVKMDESVQTTQDYSVVVIDPTPEATDVDEWFDFFSQVFSQSDTLL